MTAKVASILILMAGLTLMMVGLPATMLTHFQMNQLSGTMRIMMGMEITSMVLNQIIVHLVEDIQNLIDMDV